LKDSGESPERDLEEAVSRSLRDNLTPLQRTADELHQACADFVAACGSAKPGNALPALLRAQTAASSLASALSVLSNFVVVSMKPADRQIALPAASTSSAAGSVAEATQVAPAASNPPVASVEMQSEWAEETMPAAAFEAAVPEHAPASEPAFDVTSFPPDIQELHRRANRVAKVAMQDIKLLRPKDVQSGRENKDICERLRSELDKARKEYDRRFRAIQDHPVDYFHRWMVEILAEGNAEALGEYPYPSPVLRR
jgi:hypothetical protein